MASPMFFIMSDASKGEEETKKIMNTGDMNGALCDPALWYTVVEKRFWETLQILHNLKYYHKNSFLCFKRCGCIRQKKRFFFIFF